MKSMRIDFQSGFINASVQPFKQSKILRKNDEHRKQKRESDCESDAPNPWWLAGVNCDRPCPRNSLAIEEDKQKKLSMRHQEEEQKGSRRQIVRKIRREKRDSGLTKDWVPEELVQLAKQVGWVEVVRLARRPTRQWWKFWEASA